MHQGKMCRLSFEIVVAAIKMIVSKYKEYFLTGLRKEVANLIIAHMKSSYKMRIILFFNNCPVKVTKKKSSSYNFFGLNRQILT